MIRQRNPALVRKVPAASGADRISKEATRKAGIPDSARERSVSGVRVATTPPFRGRGLDRPGAVVYIVHMAGTTTVTLRIPVALKEDLESLAAATDRSEARSRRGP
jgi:hypothetical protein